ncbi:MAG TPA: type II secretion system F family protein [Naasia sp.]
MTAALGVAFGAGLVLLASPWLWPAGRRRPVRAARRAGRIATRLAAAGISGSPRMFGAVSALTALVSGGIAFGLTGMGTVAALAGGAGGLAPWTALGWRAARRRAATRRAWPDLVDHLVAALRAGTPLPEAVGALADVGPAGTAAAFSGFADAYRATASFGVAADELKDRLADPTADRLVEILRMARNVGGSELPSVLRALAASLRQESAARAEAEARQSWTTNGAKLGVAAPWLVLLLLSTRPEAAAAYSSPAGVLLLVGGAAVSAVAYRLMLAIARLPEDGRWFR